MKACEFFWIKPDPEVSNPIQIQQFKVTEDYTEGMRIDPAIVPKHQVAYFDYSPKVELCDVLFVPTFLIQDEIKRVWKLYEPKMQTKGVQLFARDQEVSVAPMYWCPVPRQSDCVHQHTQYRPDGTVKELYVQWSAIEDHAVVQVAGVREPMILISLPVAESMYKRSATGFVLQPVHLV